MEFEGPGSRRPKVKGVVNGSLFLSFREGVVLMDFLQNATDDQIALMGCFVALIASAGLMYVSVFLSRSHRKSQVRESTNRTLSLTARESRSPQPATEGSQRKVA